MSQVSQFHIFDELQKWSKTLPFWEQTALLELAEKGQVDIVAQQRIYDVFCIDNGLKALSTPRQTLDFKYSAIPQAPSIATHSKLVKINSIKGVNAIAEDQPLRIGAHLTVIYGSNGSGKSGYARVLKGACFTRSPDTEIYGDVNKPAAQRTTPQAIFNFEDGTDIQFTQGTVCERMRDDFAVFDSSCIRVSTDSQNNFVVNPYGFDIFGKLSAVVDKIKVQLEADMKEKTADLSVFQRQSQTEISNLLNNITASTDVKKLDRLGVFGEEEEKQVKEIAAELAKLSSRDVPQIINEKISLGKDVKSVVRSINGVLAALSQDKVNAVKEKIKEVQKLKAVADAASAAQFKQEPVQPVGSEAWISLIEAAVNFNQEVNPQKPFPVESEDARCLLCQQALSSEAKDRLRRFFSFVRSTAEADHRKGIQALEQMKEQINGLNLDFFSKESAVYRSILKANKEVCEQIKKCIEEMRTFRTTLVGAINSRKLEIPAISAPDLTPCRDLRKSLAQEVRALRKEDVSKKKAALESQLGNLEDQRFLNRNLVKIKKAIENLSWNEKAKKAKQSLASTLKNSTDTQKELSKEMVAKGYKTKFADECRELKIRIPIDFNIAGSDQVTKRAMVVGSQIDKKQLPQPSKILSEGEQTAVALADFLAEVSLINSPIGLIFDDPVNSMDHLRKESIAKRLAAESTKRQVIIFTHDIIFTHYLAEACQDLGKSQVSFQDCTISIDPTDHRPGYTDRIVFPYVHHEKLALKKVEDCLAQAKTVSGDQQLSLLKKGCGILRAAYEDFIQRDIFKDVVRRWREDVKATLLEQVITDPETSKAVVSKFELLSRYIDGHSNSLEYQQAPLTCDILEEEVKAFNEIRKEFKKKSAEHNKKAEEEKRVFVAEYPKPTSRIS